MTTGLGRWLVAMVLAVAAVLLSQATSQAQATTANATGSKNIVAQEWYVQGDGTVTIPNGPRAAWQIEVKIQRKITNAQGQVSWSSPLYTFTYFGNAPGGTYNTLMQMVNNSANQPAQAGTDYRVLVTGTWATAVMQPAALPQSVAYITVFP